MMDRVGGTGWRALDGSGGRRFDGGFSQLILFVGGSSWELYVGHGASHRPCPAMPR